MKKGWEIKAWSDVLEIRSGRNQKQVISPDGIYPILGSAGKVMGYAKEYLCEGNATIIGRKGTIDKPLFIESKFWNVDTAFGLIAGEKLDSKFLHYFCLGYNFLKHNKGTTLPSLVKKDLVKIPIPVPPLAEQEAIVEVLDKAFAAIDQAKANIEQNIANAKELFQSKLNQIFSQKGEGWVEKTLGEIGTLTSSKRIFKKDYVTSGVPFYRSKEIKELAHGREISLELFITRERYEEIKSKFGIPQKGDILLTAVGTIGEMYVVNGNEEFYFKDGNLMWLKNFDSLDSYYLKYALTHFVDQLKAMSRGTAYSALTIEKLKKYSIPVPSDEMQKDMVTLLDMFKTKEKQLESHYKNKLASLDELKKSILQKAFSGQLTD